jgi:methionyl-tRNA synthetase
VPFDGDGSFSWERFEERYNADLANALGNLASRTISMVERYCGGVVPGGVAAEPTESDTQDAVDLAAYHAAMDGSRGYLLHEALRHVWSTVRRGNEYVDTQAPWKLAKDPALRPELERTLAALMRQLARHAIHLHPFMPAKSAELWRQLGAPGVLAHQRFSGVATLDASGWRVAKGDGLFPKEIAAPAV